MSGLEQQQVDHETLLEHGVKLNTICKKIDENKEGQEKILEKIDELNNKLSAENKERMENCLHTRTDFNKTFLKSSTFWKVVGALFTLAIGSYGYAYAVVQVLCNC